MWAAGTIGALLLGPVVLALWLAPVAAAAAAQAARSWRRDPGGLRPDPVAAFATAGVVVLGAAFGLYPLVAVALRAAVGGSAWATATSG